jgi:hypothetical protein
MTALEPGGPEMVIVEFGLNLMGYRPGERIEVVLTEQIRRLAAGGAVRILPVPPPPRSDTQ